ncbi:uncharacterized protein N7483_006262 [Penicillium malachiteum]|uniref:uncharacterized protein n=1 Tax=Penicillium malachiteum TaxID=1324776 RepID=UPI002548426A|nr:uncharacterized protein N7483_006262 [Penicillium malachiteum]KAJ5731754.1 hypothetical protein N7483_006262 [Penicillium malachiteum]
MVKEGVEHGNHTKPHPYFTTKLQRSADRILDHYIADDLFHMYPKILALGVVLVKIGAKQPFIHTSNHDVWDESMINDSFEWAWTTANSADFGNSVGAMYKATVESYLNTELFSDGPIDPSKLDKDLETRR